MSTGSADNMHLQQVIVDFGKRSNNKGRNNMSDQTENLDLETLEEKTQEPFQVETTEDDLKIATAQDLEAVYEIPVKVSAVLGQATMQVNQLLKLGRGAVVELDRKVGEPIDIYVNNRLVARGEVVIVDERLGVTMTEIIKTGN
jgi:flagellar motor switch protein FliN/FliY